MKESAGRGRYCLLASEEGDSNFFDGTNAEIFKRIIVRVRVINSRFQSAAADYVVSMVNRWNSISVTSGKSGA